jgi:hypothetical protein
MEKISETNHLKDQGRDKRILFNFGGKDWGWELNDTDSGLNLMTKFSFSGIGFLGSTVRGSQKIRKYVGNDRRFPGPKKLLVVG